VLERVQGHLNDVEPPGSQGTLELAEGRRAPVRDADPVDSSIRLLLLEPWQVLLPGDEVVHLLDLDAAEESMLLLVLPLALRDVRRPDLRRDGRPVAPSLQGGAEGRLGATVHRRRVEHGDA
jgi:hypothetical protein